MMESNKRMKNTNGAARKDGGKRKNATSKNYLTRMLPGYNKQLPPRAQELVEQALLDDDLAEASPDDARWVKLYEDLHRLVYYAADPTASTSNEPDDDEELDNSALDSYRWASPSPSPEPSRESPPAPQTTTESDARHEAFARNLPRPDLLDAVHRHISSSITYTKARHTGFINDIKPESWDPSSLVALSILVEEIAKSQAGFSAQRTMFAKSPRNQALAAARKAKKANPE